MDDNEYLKLLVTSVGFCNADYMTMSALASTVMT